MVSNRKTRLRALTRSKATFTFTHIAVEIIMQSVGWSFEVQHVQDDKQANRIRKLSLKNLAAIRTSPLNETNATNFISLHCTNLNCTRLISFRNFSTLYNSYQQKVLFTAS
ncbi:putative importin-7 [Trichinella pseudospiralis]